MAKITFPINTLAQVERSFLDLPVPGAAPLPVANSTKSYWLYSDSHANPLAKEGSEGALTQDADVCIIGAGITGVSTAWHLSKQLASSDSKPLKVVILEARDFCSGATGRNGGHLTPRSFLEFSTIEKLYGTEEARRSSLIEDHTTEGILEFLKNKDSATYVDLVTGGHIALFVTREEEDLARADFEAADKAGLDISQVQWITKEEMNETYGTPYSGVLTPGHNLWPSKLVTNLYRDAVRQTDHIKLTMHTNTPVTAITHLTDSSFNPSTSSLLDVSSDPPRRHIIHTPRGGIKCASVVHATNAYASYLLPHMQGPDGIIPTRGQVVALKAAVTSAELTKRSWYGNEGFEYWFPRPLQTRYTNPEKEDVEVTGEGLQTPLVQGSEGHPVVILGGGREAEGPGYEYYNADDSTVGEKAGKVLRDFLPGLFPGKYEHGREPEMEWTGVMGFTKTGDPFVGPVAPFTKENEGQFIAAGYHGHGMPRTFACAEAIADILMKELNGGKFEHWLAPEWLPERYLTRSKR